MAQVDKIYHDLLQRIINDGVKKEDRTGNGTTSIFGEQLRFDVSNGQLPLITTKKMYTKGIIYELFWFLGYHIGFEDYKKFGLTNMKWLVDNDVNIWIGDAYKKYENNIPNRYVVGNDSDPMNKCMIWKQAIDHMSGYPILERFTKEEFIEKLKTDDDFAMEYGELGPVYGKQWIGWDSEYGQINQIEQIIQQLISNPDSRRIMVNAWNVSDLHNMVLPPCHYGFQIYTRELNLEERKILLRKQEIEKSDSKFVSPGVYTTEPGPSSKYLDSQGIPSRAISLMWNQRSVDTFLGLPFNIASYALLLHMLAVEVNMAPDELICSLGDTHIYNGHIEAVNEQLERDVHKYESAKIKIKKGSKSFFELSPKDIEITNYKSYKTIKTELYN